jgi:hypothetical protein
MRKTVIACLAVALVVAGGLVALLRPMNPSRPVSRATFERVEEGMIPTEVHAIIGLPPGDYRTGPPSGHPPVGPYKQWERFETWEMDEGGFIVCFDDLKGGRASSVWFEERVPPGPVELARWRLRKLKGALLP